MRSLGLVPCQLHPKCTGGAKPALAGCAAHCKAQVSCSNCDPSLQAPVGGSLRLKPAAVRNHSPLAFHGCPGECGWRSTNMSWVRQVLLGDPVPDLPRRFLLALCREGGEVLQESNNKSHASHKNFLTFPLTTFFCYWPWHIFCRF